MEDLDAEEEVGKGRLEEDTCMSEGVTFAGSVEDIVPVMDMFVPDCVVVVTILEVVDWTLGVAPSEPTPDDCILE